MISFLRGEVIEKNSDSLVLLIGGVGLKVFVPGQVSDQANMGETISLNTYLAVKETRLPCINSINRNP